MNRYIRILTLKILTFASASAFAGGLQFDNLDQKDVEDIVNDVSGAMAYTAVSPASSLGDVWGFEVGLVGGVADTPNLNRLVQEVDSQADVSKLPHGGLLGRVSLLGSFTFEAMFLPEWEQDGSSFQSRSLALQWTAIDALPFTLAVKGHMTNLSLKYSQVIDGADTDVEFENEIMGLQLVLSKSLVVIEPYVGVGYLSASGDMNIQGTKSFFNQQFTSGQSASAEVSSTHLFGGVEANLLLLKLGAEVGQLYGNTRYSVKLSAGF